MSEAFEMQTVAVVEYEAVRGGGAGLFDLSARGRIEVRGAEAVQFLNGLITNDVKTLAPAHGAGPKPFDNLKKAIGLIAP